MSKYQEVQKEFFQLQKNNELESKRFDVIEIVARGRVRRKSAHGFTGVDRYFRKDGSLICEEECRRGAAWGCTRFYDREVNLVGQDQYKNGVAIETYIFS